MDPKSSNDRPPETKLANWRYFLLFVRMEGDGNVTNRLKTGGERTHPGNANEAH